MELITLISIFKEKLPPDYKIHHTKGSGSNKSQYVVVRRKRQIARLFSGENTSLNVAVFEDSSTMVEMAIINNAFDNFKAVYPNLEGIFSIEKRGKHGANNNWNTGKLFRSVSDQSIEG